MAAEQHDHPCVTWAWWMSGSPSRTPSTSWSSDVSQHASLAPLNCRRFVHTPYIGCHLPLCWERSDHPSNPCPSCVSGSPLDSERRRDTPHIATALVYTRASGKEKINGNDVCSVCTCRVEDPGDESCAAEGRLLWRTPGHSRCRGTRLFCDAWGGKAWSCDGGSCARISGTGSVWCAACVFAHASYTLPWWWKCACRDHTDKTCPQSGLCPDGAAGPPVLQTVRYKWCTGNQILVNGSADAFDSSPNGRTACHILHIGRDAHHYECVNVHVGGTSRKTWGRTRGNENRWDLRRQNNSCLSFIIWERSDFVLLIKSVNTQ